MYPVKEIKGFVARTADIVPEYKEIPDEFKKQHNPWVKLQQRWFFEGLPKSTEFVLKEGVDGKKATRHLATVQRCWDLQHEHKEASVAYLMSQWFKDVKIDGKSAVTEGTTQ